MWNPDSDKLFANTVDIFTSPAGRFPFWAHFSPNLWGPFSTGYTSRREYRRSLLKLGDFPLVKTRHPNTMIGIMVQFANPVKLIVSIKVINYCYQLLKRDNCR